MGLGQLRGPSWLTGTPLYCPIQGTLSHLAGWEVCDGAHCSVVMNMASAHQTRKLRNHLIRVRIVPQWKRTNSITGTISRSCVSTSRMSPWTSSTLTRLSTAARITTSSSPRRAEFRCGHFTSARAPALALPRLTDRRCVVRGRATPR